MRPSHFMAHGFQAPTPLTSFTLILLVTGRHRELLKTLQELFLLSIVIHILLPPAFSGVSFLFLLLKAKRMREGPVGPLPPRVPISAVNRCGLQRGCWAQDAPSDSGLTLRPAAAAAAPSPWATSLLPQPAYLLLPALQRTTGS